MIDCNFDKTCVQSMFVQHFGANGRVELGRALEAF